MLTTIGEKIVAINATVDGIIDSIPGEPPGALSRTPTACALMRRFTNKEFSATAARDYTCNILVYLDARNAQQAERQTWAIIDAVLNRWATALKLDETLARGVSSIKAGECLFVTIGGVPYRVVVFSLTINEHVNLTLEP